MMRKKLTEKWNCGTGQEVRWLRTSTCGWIWSQWQCLGRLCFPMSISLHIPRPHSSGQLQVEKDVLEGASTEQILKFAHDQGIDLIVVNNHEQSSRLTGYIFWGSRRNGCI